MTPSLHAPSPAPSTGSASRRRRALLVPVLTAVSAVLLAARLAWASDTFQNCRYLGPSARMYITSWAGLACAVAAVVAFAALPRSERRGIAAVSAVLGMLLAFVLLMTVYWLYTPDPSGGDDCSGLGLLTP
ncbi:hypothetical protein AB0D42_37155 [Streptomyces sp. NPDC048304]|uniref:hypothetical protein n=1 Tax=Streptomyces sp. NPDC048304 TaxID=3154820 RepID=UPI0033D0366D